MGTLEIEAESESTESMTVGEAANELFEKTNGMFNEKVEQMAAALNEEIQNHFVQLRDSQNARNSETEEHLRVLSGVNDHNKGLATSFAELQAAKKTAQDKLQFFIDSAAQDRKRQN